MKTTKFLQTTAILGLIIFGLNNISAQIQAQRVTYVTANGGSDTNLCTRSAPCRQIQRGVNLALRGGSVIILDSGEYDPFTITKSVTISTEKGITAIVGNAQADTGISIDDDGVNEQIITIRGLTLFDSRNGIKINDPVTSLSIEDCTIRGVLYGIHIIGGGRYVLKNIQVSHMDTGVKLAPSAGVRIIMTIDDSRFEQLDTIGVEARGTDTSVTIRNTISTYNPTGFSAISSAKMVIENSIANNNTWGIVADSGGSASVSSSTIDYNGTGLRNYAGTIRSFGNNRFSNNSTNTTGTISTVSQQ